MFWEMLCFGPPPQKPVGTAMVRRLRSNIKNGFLGLPTLLQILSSNCTISFFCFFAPFPQGIVLRSEVFVTGCFKFSPATCFAFLFSLISYFLRFLRSFLIHRFCSCVGAVNLCFFVTNKFKNRASA